MYIWVSHTFFFGGVKSPSLWRNHFLCMFSLDGWWYWEGGFNNGVCTLGGVHCKARSCIHYLYQVECATTLFHYFNPNLNFNPQSLSPIPFLNVILHPQSKILILSPNSQSKSLILIQNLDVQSWSTIPNLNINPKSQSSIPNPNPVSQLPIPILNPHSDSPIPILFPIPIPKTQSRTPNP